MLEAEVERYFVWVVARLGGKADKIEFVGKRGCPDRLVRLPESLWLVELKRPKGGRLSALQKEFAKECEQLNNNYACLWSIEQIDQWAAQIRRR